MILFYLATTLHVIYARNKLFCGSVQNLCFHVKLSLTLNPVHAIPPENMFSEGNGKRAEA